MPFWEFKIWRHILTLVVLYCTTHLAISDRVVMCLGSTQHVHVHVYNVIVWQAMHHCYRNNSKGYGYDRPAANHTKHNKSHDDIIKRKHFPRYWPFVRNIHRSPVKFSKRPVTWGFWYFLWSTSEQTIVQIIETPVIWDAIALTMTSLLCQTLCMHIDFTPCVTFSFDFRK